jgi:hypothetical protein
VKSSTSVRKRKRRPLGNVGVTKSIDQRKLRPCGTAIGARLPIARLTPAIYAAARRPLRTTDGSAPRTAAITAQQGIDDGHPIAAG